MKRNGDTFRAQYLRVQEPYLSIAGETECEATLELPENSKLWVNLVVDIYFRESPRHPERHIGWWMQRREGHHVTLSAKISRDAKGRLGVAAWPPPESPAAAVSMFREHLNGSPEDLLVMVAERSGILPASAEKIRAEMDALPSDVRERIVVLEGLVDEEMAWLYRRAELLLSTSGRGGFSLPVPEARAFGLQVLALSPEGRDEGLDEDVESYRPVSVLLEFFR